MQDGHVRNGGYTHFHCWRVLQSILLCLWRATTFFDVRLIALLQLPLANELNFLITNTQYGNCSLKKEPLLQKFRNTFGVDPNSQCSHVSCAPTRRLAAFVTQQVTWVKTENKSIYSNLWAIGKKRKTHLIFVDLRFWNAEIQFSFWREKRPQNITKKSVTNTDSWANDGLAHVGRECHILTQTALQKALQLDYYVFFLSVNLEINL